MESKRQQIDTLRQMLKERNVDTNFTNKFLYDVLLKQGKWLIKREISSGNIYKNTNFFQTISCMDVEETSIIPKCCSIKTNCKIYRTKEKLPEIWQDDDGPVIKSVTSIDGSTEFFVTKGSIWAAKRNDPYQKMVKLYYTFFEDGYLWFPVYNPHKVTVSIFPVDDLSLWSRNCTDCDDNKECIRFLDTSFMVPTWVEAELFAKCLQQLVPTLQLQPDNQIDKNNTRKN